VIENEYYDIFPNANRFEEEMKFPLRNILEKQPTKKRPMCLTLKYQSFLVEKIFLKNML
jgi:hypothetical protein